MQPKAKPYREGSDPEVSEPDPVEQDPVDPTAESTTGSSPSIAGGASDDIPETVFLVVMPKVGEVQAVVGLPPTFPRKRDASLRDVRDSCRQLYDDAVITMTAKGAAEEVAKTLSQLAQAQMRAMSIKQRMKS